MALVEEVSRDVTVQLHFKTLRSDASVNNNISAKMVAKKKGRRNNNNKKPNHSNNSQRRVPKYRNETFKSAEEILRLFSGFSWRDRSAHGLLWGDFWRRRRKRRWRGWRWG